MAVVTVLGGSGETISLPFGSGPSVLLARSMAGIITQEIGNGSLVPVDYTGGVMPDPVAGLNTEIVVKANGIVSLPSRTAAVVDTASNSVLFGTHGDELVLSTGNKFTFFTDGGSGSIATGNGDATIVQTGSGPWNIAVGNGDNQISLSSGHNTVSTGTGSNEILLHGGHNIINSNGNDVIAAQAGSDTISASGSAPVHVYGGSADITFIGGAGAATVLGGTGSDTIFASSGGYFHGGSAGNNVIVGGEGATTIYGGGKNDALYATGDRQTQIFAAGGAETLDGSLSTGNNKFHAGSGHDLITAGSGNDTLFAGSGAATLDGGLGKNVFVFTDGDAGHVTIGDFSASQGDKIRLDGFAANEVSYALKHEHVDRAGVMVTLSDNTKIEFTGVTNLVRSDFT